ncbi:Uncharacterized protein PECH_006148 [Penicillium ucsense]|uniref:Uncharacterized protein n=1 Tax=Penicillium ucsense TaxID=2839758 RepID=A0A8J8W2R1_9EURO|nr:Uncharacterized protein PECM_008956 [Penicillium ucsense]KAF7735795.1 Uncharacterized protein PECH_006148 [Penicillium ucsense]
MSQFSHLFPSRLFSREAGSSTGRNRNRAFLYMSLIVFVLLLTYQLVLSRESFQSSISKWKLGPSATNSNHGAHSTDNSTTSASDRPSGQASQEQLTPLARPRQKELVIAAMSHDNMSWVEENVPDWHANIYRADVAPGKASLTVPVNKGNEAMVFLTYIIDRYDSLPDVSLFLHGGRYQWHNDNPLYDSVISINHLQLNHVQETGYANLRCTWIIGCPAELEPARYLRDRPQDPEHPTAVEFPDRFMELFPDEDLPDVVGAACCSQFAVSRDRIRSRRKEDYSRARQFLIDTSLDSQTSGRIIEYVWHIMFGKPAQYCPDTRQCYCQTYGYCNMTDEDLRNQWVWRGLKLPDGWPESEENTNKVQKRRGSPSSTYWMSQ